MNEKLKLFLSSPLIKDSLKLSFSNLLLYFLPLIVTPILTRLYLPEVFGEWGIFTSAFSIISVIIFLCYENAIIKSNDSTEIPNIISLCFIIAFAIILLCIIIYLICSHYEITFFSTFPSFSLFVLFLILYSFATISTNIANRKKKYYLMSFTNIIQGVSQAVFRLGFGVFIIFNNGLIAGTIFAQCVSLLFFIYFLSRDTNKNSFKEISVKRIKQCMVKFKKFPLYEAPSTLLLFAAFSLPVIILSLYFSKSDIGCFSLVTQLLLLPISFIGIAIGRVYYKQISENINNASVIRSKTLYVINLTALLSIIPILVIAFGGEHIITLFLGEKWETASGVTLCLVIWSTPTILTQPLLPIYRTLNKQDVLLKYNIIYFLIGVISVIGLCQFTDNLFLILSIYAILCSLIKFAIFRNMIKLVNIRFKEIKYSYFIIIFILIAIIMIRVAKLVISNY